MASIVISFRVCCLVGIVLFWASPVAAQQSSPSAVEAPKRVDRLGDPLPEGALLRLGITRWRHGDDIAGSALSPDGKTLATSSQQNLVIWDLDSGKEIRRFSRPQRSNYARAGLVFSPDGTRLAYVPDRWTAYVYDVASGAEIHRLEIPERDPAQCISPTCGFINDGKMVVFIFQESLKTLHLESKRIVSTVAANASRLSANGKYYVLAQGKSPTLGDVATGRVLRKLDAVAHSNGIEEGVAFSPDGKSFSLLHDNKEIQMRSLPAGEILATIPINEDAISKIDFKRRRYDYRLEYSADGKTMLLGTLKGVTHRFDIATGEELAPLEKHSSPMAGMHSTPDGHTLVTTSRDGVIKKWYAATGKPIVDAHTPSEGACRGAFSPDGQLGAIIDARGRIDVWQRHDGKRLHRIETGMTTVDDACFGHDGKSLAVVQRSGRVTLWPIGSDKPAVSLREKSDRNCFLCKLDVAPNGRYLAVNDYPYQTVVLDTTSHAIAWRARAPYGVAFSVNGDSLFACGGELNHDVTAIETNGWRQRWNAPLGTKANGWVDFAVAPSGRHFGVVAHGNVTICETHKGQETRRLVEKPEGFPSIPTGEVWENRIGVIAFSPDSRWLASAGTDGKVTIWDLLSGRAVATFGTHDAEVVRLAFGPEGRTVASWSEDGRGYVWTLQPKASREPALSLPEAWSALAAADPVAAYFAQWRMISDPNAAIVFLKGNFRPAAEIDPIKVKKMIADLDSPKFAEREAAIKVIESAGAAATPTIRDSLNGELPIETRRRLESIVAKIDDPRSAPRGIRALQVLELIGTSEARAILATFAAGPRETVETDEARASLDRLSARDAKAR